MAKFLPGVGEITTIVESTGKLLAAGCTAPFDPDTGRKLLTSAGAAWQAYSQENLVACLVQGDSEGIAKGADAFSQSCPIVAHARGFVHLARGDAGGYECLANGTKAAGLIAATTVAALSTGGAAAVALSAGVAAGTQVALDGVDSAARSAAAGEFQAAGTVLGAQRAWRSWDAVHIAEALLAPLQTAAVAAVGADVGRLLAPVDVETAAGVPLPEVPMSNGPSVVAQLSVSLATESCSASFKDEASPRGRSRKLEDSSPSRSGSPARVSEANLP